MDGTIESAYLCKRRALIGSLLLKIKDKPMAKASSIDPDLYEHFLDKLREYLQSGDFLITHERQVVLAAVLQKSRPFLASELHQALLDSGSQISLTTVYNTLNLFCRAGIAIRLALQSGTYFLPILHCQHRLIVVCNECGKVVYLRRYKLYEQLLRTIVPHFSKVHHAMLSFGYCKECRRKLFTTTTKKIENP
ncbi:transcriptional regulator, Fur family [Bacteroidales bacterium KA00251]|nr:transcriptional regulator, Fur family [Bacteroidales bacterium KA00251]